MSGAVFVHMDLLPVSLLQKIAVNMFLKRLVFYLQLVGSLVSVKCQRKVQKGSLFVHSVTILFWYLTCHVKKIKIW